jgi:nucleotide-binding universal stress UspA family protein
MIELAVYGAGTSSHEYIRQKLDSILSMAGVSYKLKDIRDVNDFIAHGIQSIPAIKINGYDPISIKLDANYHKNLRQLIQTILIESKYGNMKKILVPTDFSPAAENAYAFASNVAQYLNGMVKLLHVYHPSFTEIDGTVYVDENEFEDRVRRLENFVEGVNQDWIGEVMSTPLTEGEVVEGFPAEEIIEKSKEYDFLILSAQGENKGFKRIFGSVSTEIALNSNVPVIVVPEDYHYKTIKKIMYATDDYYTDSIVIPRLSQFAKYFGADLIAVHVETGKKKYSTEKLEPLANVAGMSGAFSVEIIEGDDVVESLRAFASENEVDLVAFGRRDRGFFYDLFHPSFTKKMAIITDIPLLIINGEEDVEFL